MSKEEIEQKKSDLIGDILSHSSSMQLKMVSLDALWVLAKTEALIEWRDERSKKDQGTKQHNYEKQ